MIQKLRTVRKYTNVFTEMQKKKHGFFKIIMNILLSEYLKLSPIIVLKISQQFVTWCSSVCNAARIKDFQRNGYCDNGCETQQQPDHMDNNEKKFLLYFLSYDVQIAVDSSCETARIPTVCDKYNFSYSKIVHY